MKRKREADNRADYMPAMICTLLANANRDPKKVKAFKLADFWLGAKRIKRKPQTDEQMAAIGKMICQAFGGKIVPRAEYDAQKKQRQVEYMRKKAERGG